MSTKTFSTCLILLIAGCTYACLQCNHDKKKRSQHISLVHEISSSKELATLCTENSTKPVLVKVYAPWCPACKTYESFQKIAEQHGSEAVFCAVNIDKLSVEDRSNGMLADVTRLPTTKVFKGGILVEEKLGALDIKTLNELINLFSKAEDEASTEEIV